MALSMTSDLTCHPDVSAVYFEGTAPPYMRGREKEEIYYYPESQTQGKPAREVVGVAQLGSNEKTDSLGRLQ